MSPHSRTLLKPGTIHSGTSRPTPSPFNLVAHG